MMNTAFDQAEFDLAYPDGVERNYWSVARNRILHSAIVRAGLADLDWIEVGCGRGQVVKYLRSKNIRSTGVELADVRPLSGIEHAVFANMDATALPDRGRFTGLMLLDVIEHIEDPIGFVRLLKTAYPNIRHLLVTVPARQEVWSNYDEFYGHFRRYDCSSLGREIGAMGFRPRHMHYFFHALYPAGRAVLALTGRRQVRVSAPHSWQRMLHRALGEAFYWENKVLPGSLPGTSLLCLADTAHGE